jgi:hypothetical protein
VGLDAEVTTSSRLKKELHGKKGTLAYIENMCIGHFSYQSSQLGFGMDRKERICDLYL